MQRTITIALAVLLARPRLSVWLAASAGNLLPLCTDEYLLCFVQRLVVALQHLMILDVARRAVRRDMMHGDLCCTVQTCHIVGYPYAFERQSAPALSQISHL